MKSRKTESMHIRFTPEQKARLELFAFARGITVTQVLCNYADRLPSVEAAPSGSN